VCVPLIKSVMRSGRRSTFVECVVSVHAFTWRVNAAALPDYRAAPLGAVPTPLSRSHASSCECYGRLWVSIPPAGSLLCLGVVGMKTSGLLMTLH